MVFRKPYAFLIKYFKLLHAIIFGLLCFVVYNTTKISSFLSQASINNTGYLGNRLAEKYIPFSLKLFPFLILILFTILLVVFIKKKKSTKEYIISLGLLILAYIFLFISFNTIQSIEINILETRYLRLIRDLSIISCVLQIYPIVLSFIRLTGFDLRKFDFEKDLIELEISEKDREEFEVDFNLDTNLYKRKYNRFKRYLKYFIKENKKIMAFATVIIIGIVGLIIYNNVYKYNTKINYNEEIYNNNSNFTINKSYVVNTDYKGEILDKNYNYLLIELNAKSSKEFNKINTAIFELHINKHVFYPITKFANELKDLGTVYFDNDLTYEYKTYLLVYQIPKKYSNEVMDLKVIKYLNKFLTKNVVYYNILRLDNNSLIDANDNKTTNISEEILFNNYVNNKSKLIINSYDINNKYLINYNYKYNDIVIPSLEYVQARYSGSFDKTVLKLTYTYTSNTYYDNFYKLLYNTAKINYVIDDKKYTVYNFYNIPTKTSQDLNLYIEVPEEIKKSSYIDITFNVRNSIYKYILREE